MRAGVSYSLVIVAVAACGSASTPQTQPGTSAGPPAPLVASPAGPDDVKVASVNGRPVYGSCVVKQAARGATKQEALQQCIDFELLAQLSLSYATDPEVVDATRTALVSTFVAREYEEKYTKPSDFGDFYNKSIERNMSRIVHTEARASFYIRINVAKDAPPAEDAAAKALMEELAAATAKERGLMAPHFEEIAARVIGTRAKYEATKVVAYLDNGGLVPAYAKPLFAIPEVGRTSPAVRTQWGWDVILLTELYPAENPTPEEIAKQYLPDVQRSYFSTWASQIAQKLGITVKVFENNVPRLEDI